MEYSPRYGRFRALLRTIREEAGLNQYELADKLGKPQSFVCKSELGERRVDFVEALAFCMACNVPVSRFIARLEEAGTAGDAMASRRRRRSRKTARAG